jgi:hypothetical protein
MSPFSISENVDVAYMVSEIGPVLPGEVQSVIRSVLNYYCVRSLSRPVPQVIIRMSQVPALDLSVWPRRASRPSDRDVDLRSRPRVLVRGKLRRR